MGRRKFTRLTLAAVIAIAWAACSKPVVSGRVLDAFGKPLQDVAVSVEGTSFATATDSNGGYDIEFVPGQFKVHLKKDGYTSVTNSLNVAQSTKVPAADVILYPRPAKPGIYYVGKEKLEPLPLGAVTHRSTPATGIGVFLPGSTRTEWTFGPVPATAVLPEGQAKFVDTAPNEYHLLRASNHRGSFLAEGGIGEKSEAGLVEETPEKVGDENLLVRTVHLEKGRYGWVQFGENMLGGKVPAGPYYGFWVGSPSASLPSYMTGAAAGAVSAWLANHPNLRVAEATDCACPNDLAPMRQARLNSEPYYAEADFNGDGISDFAVVLIDEESTHQFGWSAALALFNGPLRNGMMPSFFQEHVGKPQGALLFLQGPKGPLVMGPWESEGVLIHSSGSTYVLKSGGGD